MDHFRIESVHGGDSLEFRGIIPRGLVDYDGTTFTVAWISTSVTASVEVYDVHPENWSALFSGLADNWQGWIGAQEHGSLEGHLHLSCTCDKTGHIGVRVQLRGDMFGSDWRVDVTLAVEAGQLERIAQEARSYFG
jgi:hypothetical protein